MQNFGGFLFQVFKIILGSFINYGTFIEFTSNFYLKNNFKIIQKAKTKQHFITKVSNKNLKTVTKTINNLCRKAFTRGRRTNLIYLPMAYISPINL